jgi:predicted nucleic acid-binding protein
LLVLDASIVIELLVNGRRAARIRQRLESSSESWHAPQLIDVEVVQVLRRYALRGWMDPGHGEAAIRVLRDFDLVRHEHDWMLPRVWQLRSNLTAYDAVYLALAEALPARLLTADRAFASVASKQVTVELIE